MDPKHHAGVDNAVGLDIRGHSGGKTCSIILQKAGSRNWGVPTKFLLDLVGPANLFLIAVGLSFGLLWIRMGRF